MHTEHTSRTLEASLRAHDPRDDGLDSQIDAFDDADIELALKSVCWTTRDVHQFLAHRTSR